MQDNKIIIDEGVNPNTSILFELSKHDTIEDVIELLKGSVKEDYTLSIRSVELIKPGKPYFLMELYDPAPDSSGEEEYDEIGRWIATEIFGEGSGAPMAEYIDQTGLYDENKLRQFAYHCNTEEMKKYKDYKNNQKN